MLCCCASRSHKLLWYTGNDGAITWIFFRKSFARFPYCFKNVVPKNLWRQNSSFPVCITSNLCKDLKIKTWMLSKSIKCLSKLQGTGRSVHKNTGKAHCFAFRAKSDHFYWLTKFLMGVQLGIRFPLFTAWGHLIGWFVERCEVWPKHHYVRENLTGLYQLCVVTVC